MSNEDKLPRWVIEDLADALSKNESDRGFQDEKLIELVKDGASVEYIAEWSSWMDR